MILNRSTIIFKIIKNAEKFTSNLLSQSSKDYRYEDLFELINLIPLVDPIVSFNGSLFEVYHIDNFLHVNWMHY